MRALVLVLVATSSLAGSRARYGGTLQLAFSGKPAEAEPLYADTPAEATLLGLVNRPLCMAPFTVTRPAPLTARIEVPAGWKAADVAAGLEKARREPTPYRALLQPVMQVTASATAVDLKLSWPWPDLESALCHPALALQSSGPFKLGSSPGRYQADTTFPAGRPYLDALVVTSTDERGADCLFAERKAHLVIGRPPKDSEKRAMPFATGLLYGPSLPPGFREAFDASVDRADLVRYFVKPPAAPIVTSSAAKPAVVLSPLREVTLVFDQSLADQRDVAIRLQVRLAQVGYRVAIKPLPRRELRARWARGEYELMLFSVLLPPRPSNALAVVLSAARASDLAGKYLPTLGAIADDDQRDEKAKELLVSLAPQLAALPLYVQGLSLQVGPQVQNLKLDAWGLPKLDDVFLGGE